ncbi:hypothetical protein GCM10027027_00950 [Neomicrococcus lactis]
MQSRDEFLNGNLRIAFGEVNDALHEVAPSFDFSQRVRTSADWRTRVRVRLVLILRDSRKSWLFAVWNAARIAGEVAERDATREQLSPQAG